MSYTNHAAERILLCSKAQEFRLAYGFQQIIPNSPNSALKNEVAK